MAHARKQIRDAVVAAVTGLTTTGARVWADRPSMRLFGASQLPALLVTTGAERVDPMSIHDGTQRDRELELEVLAVVRASSGLDDALDQIALEVEMALPETLLSDSVALRLVGIDAPDFDGSGDLPVARQALRYRASYCTAAGSPETIR